MVEEEQEEEENKLCGELASALRGELGYKQGFWQQGDLIAINVIIDR